MTGVQTCALPIFVMQFKGIGPSLGPQLMAEIGDVTRFTHKGALTAFAGVDPGVNESGGHADIEKVVSVEKIRQLSRSIMDVLWFSLWNKAE